MSEMKIWQLEHQLPSYKQENENHLGAEIYKECGSLRKMLNFNVTMCSLLYHLEVELLRVIETKLSVV